MVIIPKGEHTMKKVDLKEFAGIVAENEDLEKEIKSMSRPDFSEMKRIASRYGFELSIDGNAVRNDVAEMSVDELEQALELTDTKEIGEQKNMLEGIIRFGDETVKNIMTSRLDMVMLDLRAPYSEVLKCAAENAYSRIPVFGKTQDDIRGILYIKDLIPHLNRGANFRWQSLIRQPFFVPETKKIDDLLCDFQTVKVHMAVVVDEFGGVSGLITLEDIIEEIVGEINDEFDEPDTSYEKLDDRTYLFDGRTSLSDFYKITSLDSEEFEDFAGEADTLAGLILEVKGEFPMLHEVIVCNDVSFEVVQKDKHRIVKIKAILPVASAGPEMTEGL
jgi:gliding motility-associated protein GldE